MPVKKTSLIKGAVVVDTPDPENPRDFSDFDEAIETAKKEEEEKNPEIDLWSIMGYRPIVPVGPRKRLFLVEYPTMWFRLNLMRATEEWRAIVQANGMDTAESLEGMGKVGMRLLRIPTEDGDIREATLEEVMSHFDATDIIRIIAGLDPQTTAADEVEIAGGDPKKS